MVNNYIAWDLEMLLTKRKNYVTDVTFFYVTDVTFSMLQTLHVINNTFLPKNFSFHDIRNIHGVE